MKKILTNELLEYRYDSFDDVLKHREFEYPFDKNLINLLKEENKNEQEYIYLEKGKSFAFLVLYKMKMNIFTFGKLSCYINMKVVGYPCSLSESGYITNDENIMLEYVKNIKGAKLVLNVAKPVKERNYVIGETLPTCILNIYFKTLKEYLEHLRSSYRRRLNKAIKNCQDIEIKEINELSEIKKIDEMNESDETKESDEIKETEKAEETDNLSEDIYNLYLNTYNKSNYKLEKLEKGFFEKVNATKLVFLKEDKPIGFVLLKKVKGKLVFMLCGMDYEYDTTDLYYYMLLNIVEYAIKNNCNIIDFGQTSEETKMKFGAVLEKRYFYAHHSNKILNQIVKLGKGVLEYNYKFPNYRVFKENES